MRHLGRDDGEERESALEREETAGRRGNQRWRGMEVGDRERERCGRVAAQRQGSRERIGLHARGMRDEGLRARSVSSVRFEGMPRFRIMTEYSVFWDWWVPGPSAN